MKTNKPKTDKTRTRKPASGKPAKSVVKKKPIDRLRKRAETMVNKLFGAEKAEALSEKEARLLVQELQTHQIELEIQNEELRNAQISLEDAKRKYAGLYDFAPVGYFTFDKTGLITEMNLTGASMLGIERTLLTGMAFTFHINKDSVAAFYDHMNKVLSTGKSQICEIELVRKNGSTFAARLESVPAGDSLLRTVISDITEQKQAEEEIRILNDQLKARNAELETSNKALDEYSYVVSHDLKAPLRSLEGFTRALLEDYKEGLDERGQDYLNRVHAASKRMTDLIDAMLSIAQVTGAELSEKKVDLSSLAIIKMNELRQDATGRDVEFVIAKDIKARGDIEMLRIVVNNLFENAWKFTSKTKNARIEFGMIPEGPVFFVMDNGAGFEMKYANKLFVPFQRLHSTTDFPGLGIGLATVQRIIRRHGGRVWAEGAVGKGATIYFTLG